MDPENQSYCAIDGMLLNQDGSILYRCPPRKTGEAAIPESVTEIADYAFSGCSDLTSIAIPDSVTVIGSDAFFDCSGLTQGNIPESITTIGNCAFSGCDSLPQDFVRRVHSAYEP